MSLVRLLAVWVLVFGVEVAVDGLDELFETELDHAVGNTHSGGSDALLGVVGGESPDGATAPVVACTC